MCVLRLRYYNIAKEHNAVFMLKVTLRYVSSIMSRLFVYIFLRDVRQIICTLFFTNNLAGKAES